MQGLLAGSLLAVAVGALAAGALTEPGVAAVVARTALLTFIAAALLTHPSARDVLLIVAAALVALAVALRAAEPLAVLGRGLDLGAFLAAFLLTLGTLREAAATSPLVRRAGAVLTGQPPGRRYLALGLGGHVIGIILSFGVLTLLGTMIRAGNTLDAASGDPRVRVIRERRMMAALLRGFSTVPVWAPTSVNQALLLTLIPGLRWAELAPLGLGVALLFTAFGWLADRLAWRAARRTAAAPPSAPAAGGGAQALRPLGGMLLLVAAVLGLVFVVDAAIDRSLVLAAMITAPPFALGWIAVQHGRGGEGVLRPTLTRLGRIVARGFPAGRGEVLVLSCAGFIGTGLAALVPPTLVPELTAGLGLPPFALLAGLTLIVPLASQLAINPIVSVTLLGAAVQQGMLAGVDPRLPALALATGWTLSLLTSPVSAAVLIVAGMTGLPVWRVAYRWNGLFVLAGYPFVVTLLFLLWLWLGR